MLWRMLRAANVSLSKCKHQIKYGQHVEAEAFLPLSFLGRVVSSIGRASDS